MATLISKPDVVEFIDFLSGEEGQSIHMESVAYENLPEAIKRQNLAGNNELEKKPALIVLALRAWKENS